LLAQNINLVSSVLSVAGGNGGADNFAGGPGGFNVGRGGGGAGGIIDIQGVMADSLATNPYLWANLDGGTGFENGQGGFGTVDGVVFVIPEPPGIVLATIASLCGLGYRLSRWRAAG
jgi:hypothetical protein